MRSFADRLFRSLSLRALAAAATLWAAPAQADNRVALVIGNGAYKSVPALPNPPNDAREVAQSLKQLGFKVTLLVDADRATFEAKVAEFGKQAIQSDVSLFYYGGHGLQVASRNFLLPVDAEVHKVADIDKATVHLDDILQAQTGGDGLHFVFLDACREDPTRFSKTPVGSAGLAKVEVEAPDFYIVYATAPNHVARDGAGLHSPFAQALLDNIATPNQEFARLMIEVNKGVSAATGDTQTPWQESSPTREFYFSGGPGEKASPETSLWQYVAQQQDKDLLQHYLDVFPKGAHAADVRALLAKVANVAPKLQVADESDLWKQAFSQRDRSLTERYLKTYPGGAHAQDAAELLASLEAAEAAASDPAVMCERLATHPADATASMAGVDYATLAAQAPQAVEACGKAVREHPENPHFVALQARATFASGQAAEGLALYRKAADGGDARAMVSLAILKENADHIAKDLPGAYALYEKAAALGNADAAINLGVVLFNGVGVPKNVPRALALFRQASKLGSARATFNLAKLINDGVANEKPSESLELYRKAGDLGYAEGYKAAAQLLEAGRVVPRDVNSAADRMLECVRVDFGGCRDELTGRTQIWSSDTVRAVQTRLKSAGYYSGPIDGRSGQLLAPALQKWRLLGPPKKA